MPYQGRGRILVTTALEETWPRTGEPILFLGEWCRLYNRKGYWQQLDAAVMPYHWDDRSKLYYDYQYLSGLYEKSLSKLACKLNAIHQVEYSIRYWRILLGPWLGYFIQILFDRWQTITEAVYKNKIMHTLVLPEPSDGCIPNDMVDFIDLFCNDNWNHHIYKAILENYTDVKCIQLPRISKLKNASVIKKRKLNIKKMVKHAGSLLRFFANENDAVLYSTYLPKKTMYKVYRLLSQPPLFFSPPSCKKVFTSRKERLWQLDSGSSDKFEQFINEMIPRQIPIVYLEGYIDLQKLAERLPLPERPKFVWTSNAHIGCDVFKAWAARKTEQGRKLVIGQHGGHYGIGKWSFSEDHELAISNAYLSWGWEREGYFNIRPSGMLKVAKVPSKTQRTKSRGLLVTTTVPRYSYLMCSIIVSRQWLDYFAGMKEFVECLSAEVREKFVVRLPPQDYGWCDKGRWQDSFPELILNADSKMEDLISESRLYVTTYNATTYLEAFSAGIPTVMFWDPEHWELRDSALPFFDELERVGVFHKSPISAAQHVVDVWDSVESWWSSEAVQCAVNKFSGRYCHYKKDLATDIVSSLADYI
ncbi:MAG: LIC12162 family protein [Coxiellaceae bacterium]|nr:LIC12162 family protein [Coxiellaceae bacterium]